MYKKLKLLSIITSTTLPLFISVSCNSIQNDAKKQSNNNNNVDPSESSKDLEDKPSTGDNTNEKDQTDQQNNKKPEKHDSENPNPSGNDVTNPSEKDSEKNANDPKPHLNNGEKDQTQSGDSLNTENNQNDKDKDKNNNEEPTFIQKKDIESVYRWKSDHWQRFERKKVEFQTRLIEYRLTGNSNKVIRDHNALSENEKFLQTNLPSLSEIIWGKNKSSDAEKNFDNFLGKQNDANTNNTKYLLKEMSLMMRLTLKEENLFQNHFNDFDLPNTDSFLKLKKFIFDNLNEIKSHLGNLNDEITATKRADDTYDVRISKKYIYKLISKISNETEYIPYYYQLILIYHYFDKFADEVEKSLIAK
nr:halomucin [Mycoplasmopsis canis]WQQ12554.1 halomucin [Mycoplasmopsis canis]